MIIPWKGLLNPSEVTALLELALLVDSRPGSATAGGAIQGRKNNRELDLGEHTARVRSTVVEAFNRVPVLGYALLPRTVSTPILSLYDPGMFYGQHVDSAIGESEGRTFRSDISVTIFLSDPATYDGGELVIDSEYGTQSFKLGAGDAVFYPTLFLHEVRPVTRGQRAACVLWLESMVRDPNRRSVLLDLAHLGNWMGRAAPQDAEARQLLAKVRENLYRMWIES
ncbi:MAG: Fe2+-dependent dioxygenase [Ectothiorhodospiraceae bacterium]|nr:Fe2+-dependent dioxygenase [Chromatiales bacterium]MCP5153559.1 Fe2+-dependent dioxygenase [Ectothiorhodospiraceae bacterium]